LGGSSNTWTPVRSALRDHQVLKIDLPGSARSASVGQEISIASLVKTVAQVCRSLNIASAHFIGHSMGTIVCQHLATEHPTLVKAMLLFGPLACPPESARTPITQRAQKAMEGGAAAMQEIADTIVQGATSRSTQVDLPVVVSMVRESIMRQDAQAYGRSCLALAKAQSAALEDILIPVHLVTGDEDNVAPPNAVRAMHQRLTDCRVDVLIRCGHWTTFERPKECARFIEDFLRRR
jgi:3-oxoadipate enol-lactonase